MKPISIQYVLHVEHDDQYLNRSKKGKWKAVDDADDATPFASYDLACEALKEYRKENPKYSAVAIPHPETECSACLGEDGDFCELGCGCILWRSASYSDREVSITFCPLHEQAEKFRDVLGRLHDFMSELVECGTLDPLQEGNPAMYGQIVDLLEKESLPLFAEGERVKPADVSGDAASLGVVSASRELLALFGNGDVLPLSVDASGAVARLRAALAGAPAVPAAPLDLLRMWVSAPLHCEENDYLYAPHSGCSCVACNIMRETKAAVAALPVEPVETAAELIQRVFQKACDETESWREEPIGADLAYLAWAIAEGPGNGCVEWDEYHAAFVKFREWFAPEDPVWQFIKRA